MENLDELIRKYLIEIEIGVSGSQHRAEYIYHKYYYDILQRVEDVEKSIPC